MFVRSLLLRVGPSTRLLSPEVVSPSTTTTTREFMSFTDHHIREYIKYFETPTSVTLGGQKDLRRRNHNNTNSTTSSTKVSLTELLPTVVEGLDLSYKFQNKLIDIYAKDKGIEVAAWKISNISKQSQKQWNLQEPTVAPIFTNVMYRDGDDVSLSKHNALACELEFAFRICKPLSIDALSAEEQSDPNVLRSYVDEVYPCVEVVGTRFVHRAPHGAAHVADCCSNACVILGPPAASHSDVVQDVMSDLGSFPCVMLYDDEPVAIGKGEAVFGNPLLSLVVFAKNYKAFRDKNGVVPAGTVVLTGACSNQIQVRMSQSCRLTANFGPLGKVSVNLVP
eukprot:PhF_6_TR7339/c0_g1_i1/m.11029